MHDLGDVEIENYSSTDPEIIKYEGYALKNPKQCGNVSRRV